MAMVINTNIGALNAQRNLEKTQNLLDRSLQRLSSGLRINSAKDDAAGLAISDRMTSQIRGLNQAVRNANDGISLAQTAEGAMQEVTNNLQRIRELAVQASSDSNSAEDRQSLNAEVTQLVAEINRVATTTTFNGTVLLDGTFGSKSIQVGANQNETISISISSAKADSLGVGSSSSYSTSIAGTATTGALSVGDLTINGYQVGATTSDGVSYASGSASAIAIANAINAVTGDTGVTATVSAASVAGTAVTSGNAAINAGDVLINGVDIGAIAAAADSGSVDRGADVAAAINAVTGQTGVTATFNTSTGAVTLTSADGRNITVTTASGVTAARTGLGTGDADGDVTTTHSSVNLSSSSSSGITIGGDHEAYAGLTGGYTAATATAGAGVSSLDITTAAGAASAITIVDAALATIDSARGDLGAIQNRFESTIANLQSVAENVSAARSRIMDADFAAETAELTKAQILQQAGVAMLAQANMLPQTVLTLLQ
ncbi:MAG: flagellin [Deltaproteobacteria bacterium]|nr:MAG: flagellin [Deltaproteobacteria bacterium]